MKTKKLLLNTFDYELFLGQRSGSVDDCLLTPTNLVLDVLLKHNMKAIFFADTTHLLKLKEYAARYDKCHRDFELVKTHLQTLVREGHYVFPHIHPHWLDAVYLPEINEWDLSNVIKYRFNSIANEDREKLFNGSVNLLYEILSYVNPDYKIDSYRSGGWCIQPFEDFKPFFQKNNIKYDFSVLGGFYLFSSVQFFDFSKAPEKSIYNFSNDVTIEDKNGEFTEFNLSSIKPSAFQRAMHRVWLKTLHRVFNDHSYNRGKGQIAQQLKNEGVKGGSKVQNILTSNHERVSVELLTKPKVNHYLSYLEKNDYMHFISHPKMLIKHHLKSFDKFLTAARELYDIETDFRKMV